MQTCTTMVNNFLKHIILFFTLILGIESCSSSTSDYKEYMQYIAQSENGLTKTKTTMGLKISIKYLPIDYLVYNEIQSTDKTKKVKEDLYKRYENSLTFMLTFSPEKDKNFDVTKVGISNYEEFSERIETMNFNFSNFITLETEQKKIIPELTQMESVYGLVNKRNILLVFNKKKIIDDIRIIYKDEIFGTGTHKFLFKKKDLLAVPQFVF